MHKSTILFAGLAMLFATTTGIVTYRLLVEDGSVGLPGGASIQLGLPRAEDEAALFRAASALLWDKEAGVIRFEQNGFERRPIASITKLMTAMVALDHGIDWDKEITIEPNEYVQGGRLLLHSGEHVTMRDLFYASLLSSANNATLAYVRGMGIDQEEFVREMNRKAIELELEQTEFTDVTGLDVGNIGTAYEVARLAEHAFGQYAEIAASTNVAEYSFVIGGSGREHMIRNSNKLVSEWDQPVTGGKTGYLYEARYCLVVQQVGKVAVLLGSPSEIENLADMQRLLRLE